MTTGTVSNDVADFYFCELSAAERDDLCKLLEEESSWQQLADEMKFSESAIQDIRRSALQTNKTDSEILFTIWGVKMNHTVTELFVVLSRVKNYKAMQLIKHLVAPKYHRLIKNNTNSTEKHQVSSKKIINISDENNESNTNKPKETIGHQPRDAVSNSLNASTIPKIGYQELRDATNNFSRAHILGTGGFGTVFHGTWKCTAVAIKRIESRDTQSANQILQSLNELRYLNSCRHDNILPLYAYSMDDGEAPCLVYKLMTGGSVEQRLFKTTSPDMLLQWQHRMDIAVGTARGIQYLHTFNGNGKPLIHGDIKPANILLDNSNQPKIGDFGLAREGNYQDAAMEVSRVYGTRPYLPNEFLRDHTLSTKVDTFSFGIVLLELATGMRAYNKSYQFLSGHVRSFDECREAELMDTKPVHNAHRDAIFRRMMRQGKSCSHPDAEKRPADMVKVLKELEKKFEQITV